MKIGVIVFTCQNHGSQCCLFYLRDICQLNFGHLQLAMVVVGITVCNIVAQFLIW